MMSELKNKLSISLPDKATAHKHIISIDNNFVVFEDDRAQVARQLFKNAVAVCTVPMNQYIETPGHYLLTIQLEKIE